MPMRMPPLQGPRCPHRPLCAAAPPAAYGCAHPQRDVVAVPHQPNDEFWLGPTLNMTLDELLAGKKR